MMRSPMTATATATAWRPLLTALGGVGLSLALLGCPGPTGGGSTGGGGGSTGGGGGSTGGGGGSTGGGATAEIQGKVTGRATFTQKDGKVLVHVEVSGAPAGDHGVHVHEKGDCSDPEFKSAGGHFNPKGVAHGAPGAGSHHPGDFGNMTVGADGRGVVDLETDQLTLAEGEVSVIGRAIIIHAGADDLTTQPTGNAGGRIGCGVIAAAR